MSFTIIALLTAVEMSNVVATREVITPYQGYHSCVSQRNPTYRGKHSVKMVGYLILHTRQVKKKPLLHLISKIQLTITSACGRLQADVMLGSDGQLNVTYYVKCFCLFAIVYYKNDTILQSNS